MQRIFWPVSLYSLKNSTFLSSHRLLLIYPYRFDILLASTAPFTSSRHKLGTCGIRYSESNTTELVPRRIYLCTNGRYGFRR
jgi:hypothetical protein